MPDETLLATYNADARMIAVLCCEARIFETKPTRMAAAQPIVMKALEVTLNAHRRGGVTSGQLQELEAAQSKLLEMM